MLDSVNTMGLTESRISCSPDLREAAVTQSSPRAVADAGGDLAGLAAALRSLQRLGASRRVHAALSRAAGTDLSQQAVQVLAALDGPVPVARLAEAARMDVGAVSRQLRTLEAAGYLRREPSEEHGSVVLVTATDRGRAVADRIAAIRTGHLQRALTGWSPDERRRLAVLLQRLVDDLQATPYDGAGH